MWAMHTPYRSYSLVRIAVRCSAREVLHHHNLVILRVVSVTGVVRYIGISCILHQNRLSPIYVNCRTIFFQYHCRKCDTRVSSAKYLKSPDTKGVRNTPSRII